MNYFMMRDLGIYDTNLSSLELLDIALYILVICSSMLYNYVHSYIITYFHNKFLHPPCQELGKI